MRIVLKTLALAAVPALMLSACSTPSSGIGTTAGNLPAQASYAAHPNADKATDLHAGGATFPAYAYNEGYQPVGTGTQPNQIGPGPGSLFASAGTKGTIYYCLTGTGFGKSIFDGATASEATAPCAALTDSPTGFGSRYAVPDFVGADQALKNSEYEAYQTNREPSTGENYGEPFQFPAIGGAIVYGYRKEDLPGHKEIKFSTWTYCAIANGTITDWNDPAITADNGGSVTGGVSEPMTFYFRSDSSGTSYLFTTHLQATCGSSWPAPYNASPYQGGTHGGGTSAAWTYGASTTWPGPGSHSVPNSNFIGESGNPGVIAGIQSKAHSVGYVEGAWATVAGSPAVGQAWLQNTSGNFEDPTVHANVVTALSTLTGASISFGTASDTDAPFAGDTEPMCQMYINPSHFTSPKEASAYPIVGVSYLIFYGKNQGVHTADKIKLIKYVISKAGGQAMENLDYTPLSYDIYHHVSEAVDGTKPYKSPCIQ
ncbi:MAG TPA: substrate-binding domain-containing protein [Verrucomicrobiae bacterium]|nr:substrate-binding domain-containing protein [Verrucomicrobiae bacterium]